MPHISIPEDAPGIRGLFLFRPETARVLNDLVDVLLRSPGTLSTGERELIAAFVSSRNDCTYCQTIHGAIAACDLGNEELIRQVKQDYRSAPVSDKMKALLTIAAKVQTSGRNVTDADIADARSQGASDVEIHDTVLIAAAFCMFNRYVDGLATVAPADPDFYRTRAAHVVREGYSNVNRQAQLTAG